MGMWVMGQLCDGSRHSNVGMPRLIE